MPGTIFWDVDTQYDFIQPTGKLYVSGAEKLLPNLARLTSFAREKQIPIFGSVDNHNSDDPEISDSPDFKETFPPHCLQNTPGQEKVPETGAKNPLWIDPGLDSSNALELLDHHTGEIYFRKQRFDVFTNPHVVPVLNRVQPDLIVLYGVALDVCNAYAIDGLLSRYTTPIQLVLDATQAILPDRGNALVKAWKTQGVTVVQTNDIVGQAARN